jgi:hypothetical protein
MTLGDYAVYVKAIYYEDTDDSGNYSEGDLISEVTSSDPEVFTIQEEPALYLVTPGQSEVSHYCGSDLATEIIDIYGWAFGEQQGNGAVYIGVPGMWVNTKAALDASNPVPAYPVGGVELSRTIWSNLRIRVALDLPEQVEGYQLYMWVVKDGMITDADYGWPGIYILDVDPNTCP